MSRKIQFIEGIARKQVPRELLKIELEKTKQSRLIGEKTGLFYVPEIIGFNEKQSTIDFEYLDELITVQEVAIYNNPKLLDIYTRIGAALVAIHDNLVLSNDMKKDLH